MKKELLDIFPENSAKSTPSNGPEIGEFRSENMALFSVKLKPILNGEQQCPLSENFETLPGLAAVRGTKIQVKEQ